MRLHLHCLWTCWTFTFLTAGTPAKPEGGAVPPGHRQDLQPVRTQQRSGRKTAIAAPAPPEPGLEESRAGEKLQGGRRRESLSGPQVCGEQCCARWTASSSTKPKKCTKPRCFPGCHNGGLCRWGNRCVCRRGFHGYRCEFSTVTVSLPGQPLTFIPPTITAHQHQAPPNLSSSLQSITKLTQSSVTPPTLTTVSTSLSPSPETSSPNFGPDQSVNNGLQTNVFLVNEQRRMDLTDDEVKIKVTGHRPESNSEFIDLQPWEVEGGDKKKDTEVTDRSPGSETKNSPTENQNPSGSEGSEDLKSGGEGIIPQSDSMERLDPDSDSDVSPEVKTEHYGGSESEHEHFKTDLTLTVRGSKKFHVDQKSLDPESQPEEEKEIRVRTERTKTKDQGTKRAKKQQLSLREAQAVLLRKTLSQRGRGDRMAALLLKHIEKERKKLHSILPNSNSSSSSSSSSVKTSVRSFHTQKGQYTVHITAPKADGQTATGGGHGGGGGGVETIQVMFTPTICKVRCNQGRCVNYCERGNVTTLYSSDAEGGGDDARGRRDGSHGPGFRVFLCPLLCKNGGVCLQKDRCLCPPNFTGKFCQIPVAPASASARPAVAPPASSNEIFKPVVLASSAANQEVTQTEFLLPLGQNQEVGQPGAPSPSMVKVRVQHPPEASVKIHQVVKVSGRSPPLQTLSFSPSSGSAGAPAPPGVGVQAQTVRGDGTYTEHSGFKYCFREVKDGQCSSPLPGLRSKEMCCRGLGKGWGITDCVRCPENTGRSNSSCLSGFERSNGTQCVDVNECLQPGLCENGICVNTRGSYSCVCKAGFILDASHGICISQTVISEEKGQCHRVLGSGQGPNSCSLPILRNITKQICCCSRVGKAWGTDCQRCPYFGSVAFKEICPAGPGYHYSLSALQFNQRANEQLGNRGASLLTPNNQDGQESPGFTEGGASRPKQPPSSSGGIVDGLSNTAGSTSSGSVGTSGTQTRPGPAQSQLRPPLAPHINPPTSFPSNRSGTRTQDKSPTPGRTGSQQNQPVSVPSSTTHLRPQSPPTRAQGGGTSSVSQPVPPSARGDSLPAPAQPHRHDPGSRLSEELRPLPNRPALSPTTRPTRLQTRQSVCDSRPGVCGRGRCVDQADGKHTCVCDQGFKPNTQRTSCQDVNECAQSPSVCSVGECANTIGSYRCVCPAGYRSNSQQTSCQDVDECELTPCRNGRCENTAGSYRCLCRPGYQLVGSTCTDVDECVDPLQCPGQECINSQGSYRCRSCQPGYTLTNRRCTDVDECRQAPCSNSHCENTPGSYRCVCHHGYRLQNNTCTDIDECREPSQCPGQMCVNSVGSYRCVSCRPGYKLRNRQCTDVNECEDSGSCPGQKCVNTEGSYSCVDCQQGYHIVNGVCTDVDECVQHSQCPGQRCVNTVGSYHCVSCQPGYSVRAGSSSCQDVDECNTPGVCEAEGVCVNTIGSYRCDCPPGYRSTGLGRKCRDINECVNKTVCGDHAFCQNVIGTYMCVCDQGFTSTPDGKSCVDEDECESLQGVCGSARCENVEGSFMCECDQGEFEPTTRRCVSTARPEHVAPRYPSSSATSSSSSSSSSSNTGVVGFDPKHPPLPPARPGELRECYYNLAERGTCNLLATNTSQQECCCTVGEAWGLGCQYHTCPSPDTAEFLSLCPNGRGYIITGPGAFSYRDVDECKRFHPEVCKNGVCVNNIPGYNCYCSSGYVYNSTLLECVDHDECEEETCVGGACVNTVGSYYCSCPPPLVLDDTQRNCVNSSHLTVDENLSMCWQHVSADLMCQSPLIGAQVTFTDCCCLYGEGWGMECALCPATDSGDYAYLCSSYHPPHSPGFPDSSETDTGVRPGRRGSSSPPRFPPFFPDSFPTAPDYEDYSPAGGNPPARAFLEPDYNTGFFTEGDYSPPDGTQPRPPSFRIPPDPRSEAGFGAQPLPPLRPDGPPLSLAPLPVAPYEGSREEEDDEETWRPLFPPFSERSRGGAGVGAPRRVYERPVYAGLSTAEDCGILHGCENGRCIRVAEGYTCDCYPGYELDMTSMTCIDINECEDRVRLEFPCVNARCVNTDGSFRCICRRGYVMSRRLNHCVAA
ncbi:latent-transforming growth factor beta-binding protein 1 isoform X1 [Cynoglossus semilaevis]|uniref:latent-transforming growth factor beta-binding protein 1 isoform X1 n=1 Tax=Cynoglossus semilaevis TaxID=244447 RepID=UPI000D6309BE|nr:latent-transforming growth factor beta-binding protein 4 isoform X1 [Cynoglossus semilaevis]